MEPSAHPSLFPRILRQFMAMEAAGALVMMLAALLGMVAANSAFYPDYKAFIDKPLTLGFGAHALTEPLKVWVKDGPMVLFFLLIGLELKRESKEGVLTDTKQMLLPLLAAAAGMIVPALIFVSVLHDLPQHWAGWAIPAATDIAFALGVLAIAGRGIPPAAKVFLLAIAIFDDLGAILVIAFFYSDALVPLALALAAGAVAMLVIFNHFRVRRLWPYLVVGLTLAICLHHAGIHTTVAGVIVGLLLPMRAHGDSPVARAIHGLHPWVSFLILPLFAFTSAGVNLDGITVAALLKPLPLAIALALFLGKQLGIFGITAAAVKGGLVGMPQGTNWLQLYGVSVIAGIGFTMSLFIGILAFPEALQGEVKLGVIGGSLLSAGWGALVLRAVRKRSIAL